MRGVADCLRGFQFADDVHLGDDWVAKIYRLRNIRASLGIVIGGAFVMASIIIIGATIRMAVLHRSNEISIMSLVGATDGFIRRPFLLEGCLKGALGGLVALGLCYAAYAAVNQLLFEADFFTPPQSLLVVVVGTSLGFLASAASVGRHLKRV